MSGPKELHYPCALWTLAVLTGLLLVLPGCSALSEPGAVDRIKGLLALSADQSTQARRMYDKDQYIDGRTPQQRLEALYDQIESKLASDPSH